MERFWHRSKYTLVMQEVAEVRRLLKQAEGAAESAKEELKEAEAKASTAEEEAAAARAELFSVKAALNASVPQADVVDAFSREQLEHEITSAKAGYSLDCFCKYIEYSALPNNCWAAGLHSELVVTGQGRFLVWIWIWKFVEQRRRAQKYRSRRCGSDRQRANR